MRKGVKVAIVGGVFAAMVGGAGYGGYNFVTALNGDGGSAEKRTGPPSADEVRETTEKFFAAWEKGDSSTASSYTNDAADAGKVFGSFVGAARIDDVRIAPGKPTGTGSRTVPFSVEATVAYEGKSKELSYKSRLTVVRGKTTGRALVDWRPSVVHPELKAGDTLFTGEAAAPPIEAVDRDGKVLTKEKYPSLGPILDTLRERYGADAGGTPGIELGIRHTTTEAGDTTLLTLAEGRAGRLETTISARTQAAAEQAVKKYAESSVIALQPSTGQVLAVANHREDGFNAAFQGELPPGSTMKIVTAAMLIDNGVTSMNGPAPCPDTATWMSQTFKNLPGMKANETPSATLANSFERSCNTAFIKLIDEKPLTDASLTEEAQERFGIGRDDWKTGIVSMDGKVPPSGGPNRAANAIGQGDVLMNPLNMASVTSTAITGQFRQPYLVSPKLDDRKLATAKGLLPGTSSQLKQMMRLTATQGTAQTVMSDLSGDIGAKTGSAEIDGQAVADSWFTGFRGDVAAAAMSEGGGRGGEAAGPIVVDVLKAGG
ncbi:penicillin-binding transpeptidase domain-containing protein [Streptomyces europaeiscabiei]|uniref:Penicillin-binding transpeptidase domain-containing protein n=1 Tax=Streptomyces europaeiscabiei TaxID=146819 RepID=A0ABU4NR61_9ACTN|nr:penicillin-binding transpeptidase domain-containing protein [Streptomyces europaeiscabiei]MDX2522915.1 penicillin-binding transpeptidase domain-containing protein [Streptomyces europaeiscabiei]MDX3547143.1 penicillin-binding transpeptidase domain-containing protein [Streptomyces europaeiscabiei]MDX3556936.1 penicillin-binding transpeptidase domain-containing protein [Streptomyces europaeiscabiei]MDX3704552.1 penicillin-binding transpeptidase domain-containing protein [Streptomyces europaeisc